jgi:hypothetical protein
MWPEPLSLHVASAAIRRFLEDKNPRLEGAGRFGLAEHAQSLLAWGVPAGSVNFQICAPCIRREVIRTLVPLFRLASDEDGRRALGVLAGCLPFFAGFSDRDYEDLRTHFVAGSISIGLTLVAAVGAEQPWWEEFESLARHLAAGTIAGGERYSAVRRECDALAANLGAFGRANIANDLALYASSAAKCLLQQSFLGSIQHVARAGLAAVRPDAFTEDKAGVQSTALLLEQGEASLLTAAAEGSLWVLLRTVSHLHFRSYS